MIEQSYSHPYWNHILIFCLRRVSSYYFPKKEWILKCIEIENKRKHNLYFVLQKWDTWKLNQLLLLENRIAELPVHNRKSLEGSLVCTVITDCARTIHKQLDVIASISDYREYICFDPYFDNLMINSISVHFRPFLDQRLHGGGGGRWLINALMLHWVFPTLLTLLQKSM